MSAHRVMGNCEPIKDGAFCDSGSSRELVEALIEDSLGLAGVLELDVLVLCSLSLRQRLGSRKKHMMVFQAESLMWEH
jgi:hypothetical protein